MPSRKLTPGEKLKHSQGLCIHHGCSKPHGKKRRVCYTHKQMYYAHRYPLRARFNTLKQNAKRRGHAFALTQDEFSGFAIRTGYYRGSGLLAHDLTIDRRESHLGYFIDNLQVLPRLLNTHKRNYYDRAKSPALPGMGVNYAEFSLN